MHIIVVGAGEIGSYVADSLSREGHDVAVVERNAQRLKRVVGRLDTLGIHGSGSSPQTLASAGIDKADLLVAVTDLDEANLVASALAKQAGVTTTIARIENRELRERESRKLLDAMGVDVSIDPQEETARSILDVLEFPGASEVTLMAGGEVIVIGVHLPDFAPLAGVSLLELGKKYEPEWEFLVGGIERAGQTLIPRGNYTLEADDHIWFLCRRRSRRELMGLLGLERAIPRDVVLFGGGHQAELLAEALIDRGSRVVIVDRDLRRCQELAGAFDDALVLNGEITDPDIVNESRVAGSDAVVATTGNDDANILSCIAAKASGVPEAIAVVHRLELLPIVHEVGIDAALSPRTATANSVLRVVRGSGISALKTFLEGEIELFELEVEPNSRADGQILEDLALPKSVLVGAIVRDGNAQIARGRSSLRARDKVVIFGLPGAIDPVKRNFRDHS